MADNASTQKRRYVVYMPDGTEALCYSFHLSEEAEVQDLIKEIRDDIDFKQALAQDEDVRLLKCGDLDMEPIGKTLYHCVIEWLRNDAVRKPMTPARLLKRYFPSGPAAYEDKKIDIVVVTESILNSISSSAGETPLLSHDGSKLKEELTFNLKIHYSKDSEGRARHLIPEWISVIKENDYVSVAGNRMPPFIRQAVEMKRRLPESVVPWDVETVDAETLTKSLVALFKSLDSKFLSSAPDALPYATGAPEIWHYVKTRKRDILAARRCDPDLSINNLLPILLDDFRSYWLVHIENPECTLNQNLPFPLVARTSDGTDTQSFKYQPRPNTAFMKHGTPRFLAEIESNVDGQDEYRLYVQMACTLRLALEMRRNENISDNKFFLMGAFFTKQWAIIRFFFYAEENKIKYLQKIFFMAESDQLLTFLFEFYNYARYVRDDKTVGNKQATIQEAKNVINASGYDSLLSAWKSSSTESRQYSADRDPNHGSNTDNRAAMKDALRTSGYMVWRDYNDDDELQPLIKLPDHVVEARAPNGEGVIAKLCHKDSDELSLLRELSPQRSPHNHVIPLLGMVQSSSGPLIILPEATCLSTNLLFHDSLRGKCVQLCRELVEGVAFLHRRKIAHLDIKPDNLVYSFKSERLYIIDFDVAVQCKDVEETVELSCGTRGWSAPEVVLGDDKPLRAFNPIRADLWSCGNVLRFFARVADKDQKDRDIELLAGLLMDSEPRCRPFLHEVVDENPDFWTSGRLHRTLESRELKGAMLKRTRGDCASRASQEGPTKKVLKDR